MKLKELESYLQDVDTFETPNVQLEQYPTSAHIAARMLFCMESSYGDVAGKTVIDLGCGGGILGVAAAMMGANLVIGVDIDDGVLEIAKRNAMEFDIEDTLELINADITAGSLRVGVIDTVVTNPPFGTKNNAGIDLAFLHTAIDLVRPRVGTVYSLHKSSTRAHITRKSEEWGVSIEVVAQLRYDIPAMYKFHKKKSVDIEVDFLRFQCTAPDN